MLKQFSILIFLLLIFASGFAQIPKRWVHKKELMSYLQSPRDSVFIQNRKKLERLKGRQCNDSMLVFNCKTKSRQPIYIEIKVGDFQSSKHKLHLNDTIYKIVNKQKVVDKIIPKGIIDGQKCWGNDCEVPKKEIKSMKIVWNKTNLQIPKSAYKDLYEVYNCLDFQPAEAYLSRTKKYLFIYMTASIGAGAYAVKLVFDKKGYVTRIISTNDCTDAFDFLDGTARPCEKLF